MNRSLRRGLASASALVSAVALAGCGSDSAASSDTVVLGTVYDVSGVQRVLGQSMLDAAQLAVADINANGGVLGKDVELRSYDSGGDIAKYKQYAEQLALKDQPAVAFAGINSASREAIRPIFSRSKIPYFYTELYEGGVCDKNTFVTGSVPSQTLAAIVPELLDQPGKKVFVVAADYNYGHIATEWGKQYAEEAGAQVVGEEFVPLESSEFGSVLDEIQRAKPDLILSFLVGSNHQAFYRAYAAAGLNATTPIASSTFGTAGETEALSPAEQENIYAAYPYIYTTESAANDEFRQKWEAEYGPIDQPLPDEVNSLWNAIHMWAAAVDKAGSVEQADVIEALESGVSFEGPGGLMTMDPKSHHVVQNVSIGKTNGPDGYFEVIESVEDVEPSFEMSKCDLIAEPTTNEQFLP